VSIKDCGTGTPLTVANAPGGLVCATLLAQTMPNDSATNSAPGATKDFEKSVCMIFAQAHLKESKTTD
jgi:hypothetical protein